MTSQQEFATNFTTGYKRIDPELLDTPIAVYEIDAASPLRIESSHKLGAYTTSLLETTGRLLDVTL